MPVVINEFEVEPQPPAQTADAAQANSGKAEQKPAAHEIEKLMRMQAERCERTRAH